MARVTAVITSCHPTGWRPSAGCRPTRARPTAV